MSSQNSHINNNVSSPSGSDSSFMQFINNLSPITSPALRQLFNTQDSLNRESSPLQLPPILNLGIAANTDQAQERTTTIFQRTFNPRNETVFASLERIEENLERIDAINRILDTGTWPQLRTGTARSLDDALLGSPDEGEKLFKRMRF